MTASLPHALTAEEIYVAPYAAFSACFEYVSSQTEPHGLDVLFTIEALRSYFVTGKLLQALEFESLARKPFEAMLYLPAADVPKTLATGLLASGRVKEPALSEKLDGFISCALAFERQAMGRLFAEAQAEARSLLFGIATRAQIERLTFDESRNEADAPYAAFLAKDYDTALAGFQRLKGLAPTDWYFRNVLSAIHYERGEYVAAVREALFGSELCRDDPMLASNLLLALMAIGFYPSVVSYGLDSIQRLSNTEHAENYRQKTAIAKVCTLAAASMFAQPRADQVALEGDQLDPYPTPPRFDDGTLASQFDRAVRLDPGAFLEKKLFISYRRNDAAEAAQEIERLLESWFPYSTTFRDASDIVAAEDFVERLQSEISSADLMLVLIGKEWTGRNSSASRIDDPNDFVRREVRYALLKKISILPVLVGDACFPQHLPDDLLPLATMNGHRLPDPSEKNVEALVQEVARLLRIREAAQRQSIANVAEIGRQMRSARNSQEVSELLRNATIDAVREMPRYVPSKSVGGSGIPACQFPLHGDWEVAAGTAAGKVVVRFTIDARPGSPLSGTIEQPRVGIRPLVGTWAMLYDGEKRRQLGLWLDCLVDQIEPMSLTIPMHEKFGDGYRGRDESGIVFFSRNVNPRVMGF